MLGRYYTQAETELGRDWRMMKSDGITMEDWLYEWCNSSTEVPQRKIGVDPRYISSQDASSLKKKLSNLSAELVPVSFTMFYHSTLVSLFSLLLVVSDS